MMPKPRQVGKANIQHLRIVSLREIENCLGISRGCDHSGSFEVSLESIPRQHSGRAYNHFIEQINT